jgi:protein-S-isoprenylcysteine O-methyltransferase Ste14
MTRPSSKGKTDIAHSFLEDKMSEMERAIGCVVIGVLFVAAMWWLNRFFRNWDKPTEDPVLTKLGISIDDGAECFAKVD